MESIILEYAIIYIPVILAIISEISIFKHAISTLNKTKETAEFKAVTEQHKVLVQELRESKRLNKELLTKIDRINRGEE